jgi:hypothetical protein
LHTGKAGSIASVRPRALSQTKGVGRKHNAGFDHRTIARGGRPGKREICGACLRRYDRDAASSTMTGRGRESASPAITETLGTCARQMLPAEAANGDRLQQHLVLLSGIEGQLPHHAPAKASGTPTWKNFHDPNLGNPVAEVGCESRFLLRPGVEVRGMG